MTLRELAKSVLIDADRRWVEMYPQCRSPYAPLWHRDRGCCSCPTPDINKYVKAAAGCVSPRMMKSPSAVFSEFFPEEDR